MANGLVKVTEYTDPSCPFAYSASPALTALRWHYGEQITWRRRLVVLAESAAENEAKGITPDHVAAGDPPLRELYGMPLCGLRPARVLVPLPVDLAIKAAELIEPAKVDRYYRALQVAWHSRRVMIDDRDELLQIADDCGIDRAQLVAQLESPETLGALREDMRAARAPLAAATGPLDHKLAGEPGARRYTCPSLEVRASSGDETALCAPGMQNLAVYEVLLANAEPRLVRRAPAASVAEVLEWTAWPLAAAEIAAVMGIQNEAAEALLAESDATEADGYWSLISGGQDQLAAGAAGADRLVSGAGVA